MPSGPLEESVLTVVASGSPPAPFTPFDSQYPVQKSRYITSNDPRGYIPVYEYSVNGHWIMIDADDSFVLWTGIWKALGNSKADIVKMVESIPDLASQIRRVRGGYLKIQGTWMPYKTALHLARRVAYNIREELVPIFGPEFPSMCLAPHEEGYGQLNEKGSKRRSRRSAQTSIFSANGDYGSGAGGWAIVNWNTSPTAPRVASSQSTTHAERRPSQRQQPIYDSPSSSAPIASYSHDASIGRSRSPSLYQPRYVPYSAPRPQPSPEYFPTSSSAPETDSRSRATLAPIQNAGHQPWASHGMPPLPSLTELSAMADGRPPTASESRALLQRLRADDAAPALPAPPSLPTMAALSQQNALNDQAMHRRSEILLAGYAAEAPLSSSAPPSSSHITGIASAPEWNVKSRSIPRLLVPGSHVHSRFDGPVSTYASYAPSNASTSSFERSPITPVTPPQLPSPSTDAVASRLYALPPISALKDRIESHDPSVHRW